jgi:hypothetical protein
VWGYSLPSGIRYNTVLAWVKTAHWDHRSWESFCELDGDAQSFLVAAYLTEMQCGAVETHEAMKEKK